MSNLAKWFLAEFASAPIREGREKIVVAFFQADWGLRLRNRK